MWKAKVLLTFIAVVIGLLDSKRPEAIDEIIAVAGDFQHGKANPRGLNKPNGKRVKNGKFEIHEYDLALPLPDDNVTVEVNGKSGPNRGRHLNVVNGNGRQKRAAISNTQRFWENGRIPYVISSSFNQNTRNIIIQAMNEIHRYTCVRWIPKTTETNYINIFSGSGCWSFLGNLNIGAQDLSLQDPGCVSYLRIPIHEMLHAAGVYHEQSRPDRDQYVTINWANIQSGTQSNFDKETNSLTYGTAYDYRSVMHYGAYAFSTNGLKTVITNDANYQNVIGNAPTLGFMDIKLLTSMYNCAGSCQPANCPSEGFQSHDCSCYCPSGDPNNPVVSCGQVCLEPNQQCTCDSRTNACSGISNSQCQSGACVCNAGYQAHKGKCVLSSTISGTACDAADKHCYCTAKGATACNSVPNSSCDYATDSCKCNEDYYNNAGTCTAAPACTTPGVHCMCNIQGADACSAIPISQCDLATGACQCITGQSGSVCTNGYFLDGSQISPFTQSPLNTAQFIPFSGPDTYANGILSNYRYLFVSGNGYEAASLKLPAIAPASGGWCINYAIDLNNAVFEVTTIIDGWWTYRYYLYYPGALNYFYTHGIHFVGITSSISYELRAYRYSSSGSWSLKLDAVKIVPC